MMPSGPRRPDAAAIPHPATELPARRYRVRVFITPGQDLYHASLLYTGLCGLQRNGEASVQFDASAGRLGPRPWADALVVPLRILDTTTGRDRLACVDLYDRSDVLAPVGLEWCDVYLKRSYFAPDLARLPEGLRGKIIPFGLNFGCRTGFSTRRVLGGGGPRLVLRWLGSSGHSRARLREHFRMLHNYLALPDVAEFERDPAHPLERAVVFQTRVWAPDDVEPDDAEEINELRVGLVRALREHFGGRFLGGLVPTEYARMRYPDAITAHPTRRSLYTALSRRAIVGVYSRGLHHSSAFKLAEYLASSKCIVAEGIRNELPAPLSEGVNHLSFRSAQECIDGCEEIFADDDRVATMRHANWEYYLSHVSPVASARRLLREAFAESPGQAPFELRSDGE